MITERFFCAKNRDHWIVWDRHKNTLVTDGEYPRSAKGEREARERCAALNRDAAARGPIQVPWKGGG